VLSETGNTIDRRCRPLIVIFLSIIPSGTAHIHASRRDSNHYLIIFNIRDVFQTVQAIFTDLIKPQAHSSCGRRQTHLHMPACAFVNSLRSQWVSVQLPRLSGHESCTNSTAMYSQDSDSTSPIISLRLEQKNSLTNLQSNLCAVQASLARLTLDSTSNQNTLRAVRRKLQRIQVSKQKTIEELKQARQENAALHVIHSHNLSSLQVELESVKTEAEATSVTNTSQIDMTSHDKR
jgi:hypothetical protein